MLIPASQVPHRRPVSIAVDATGLAGLQPGQLVDVLETAGSGSTTTVTVVARGATLVAVAHAGGSLLSGPSTGEVTLGVPTLSEVEALVQAAHAGTVTVVAAELADGVGPGSGPGPG